MSAISTITQPPATFTARVARRELWKEIREQNPDPQVASYWNHYTSINRRRRNLIAKFHAYRASKSTTHAT